MEKVGLGTNQIAIVSDDRSLRREVADCLTSQGYSLQFFAFGATYQAVRTRFAYDCTILDSALTDPDVLRLLSDDLAAGISQPTIVIGRLDDLRLAVAATKFGASDFLARPVDRSELLSAVQAACSKRPACAPPVDPTIRARLGTLTPRQRQVLIGMAQGKLNKIIAHELGLSVRTVETYRAIVMEKTGGTIADAIRLAAAGGLLPPCSVCIASRASRFGCPQPQAA